MSMPMYISDRPMQKVLLKNTTRMSLHERWVMEKLNKYSFYKIFLNIYDDKKEWY